MREDTKFNVIVSMFEWIQKSKQSAKKRSKLRKFLDIFCSPTDYFTPLRLILPTLDRERGSYGLKESFLATSLIDAIGMSRESADAVRLINWRKGGAKTGSNAGNFALVAAEVLQRRQVSASGGLTVTELNAALDQLASKENRGDKALIISSLIKKTNAQEMKWIIMIILKDLKLGMSEKTIFNEFHPDADDLFNVTCDLKLVCEKLKDRTQRHKRQDIEVGKAVRPQLANRVGDSRSAWKKLHGKDVVVECKFDGDRIQVHKNGSELHYFSRNFFDHMEYALPMSHVFIQNVLTERCILDGEMVVWEKSVNRFAEFGSNREIVSAVKDGLDSDRQLCYVAFDILFVGDGSVMHQSLKERHELLNKYIKPVHGRLEVLTPFGSLNSAHHTDARCWSKYAYSVNDVEDFYKETIENRDEGIVIKDLGSNWEPGERSGKWMKLKPDYVHAGSDLDVLIIGGYYGSGRRGGEVGQFLMGLAERGASDMLPKKFISFCKVGTGLSDDELDTIVSKLKPYFRKYQYPKKPPPLFYKVTDHCKERPDVWIENPEQSIILSITSDIRTIRSEVFEAPYSLRFPRIDKVRYDKPWHECLDVNTFVDLVHSSNGTTQRKGAEGEDIKSIAPKSSRKTKDRTKVPLHLSQTDVSNVKKQTKIFSGMMIYFVNVPTTHSLESLHKIVAENGGTFSMNLNGSVTHSIAAQSKGLKFEAAKLRGDVIHCSWVFDCCSQMKLLPLKPKYYLFISNSTKKALEEDMDEFMDSYYWDVDIAEIKKLLSDIKVTPKSKDANEKKIKYFLKPKWCLFYGCHVYFLFPHSSKVTESEISLSFTMRRLKIEVLMGGGLICYHLSAATHVIVLPVHESHLFDNFVGLDKRLMLKKNVHLVRSHWLEDTLEQGRRLPEETYKLKFDVEDTTSSLVSAELKKSNMSDNKLKSPRKRSHLVKQSGGIRGNEYEDSWCDVNEKSNFKKENENNDNAGCSSESAKVEVMVDPVQAMLVDMIPSIAENESDVYQLDAQQPSKKKKVSYKDLAFQLLND